MTLRRGSETLAGMPRFDLTRPAAAVAGLLAVCGLGACGAGSGADKTGATARHDVTLTVQMPDADSASGREFARAVATRTRGSVHIRLGTTRYASSDPANELLLAKAIQRGS